MLIPSEVASLLLPFKEQEGRTIEQSLKHIEDSLFLFIYRNTSRMTDEGEIELERILGEIRSLRAKVITP